MIIPTLTHTITHITIPISIFRSLFRSTIHMTGIILIVLIMAAIIAGVLTIDTTMTDGGVKSKRDINKSYSSNKGNLSFTSFLLIPFFEFVMSLFHSFKYFCSLSLLLSNRN